jgi:hypothetical protein
MVAGVAYGHTVRLGVLDLYWREGERAAAREQWRRWGRWAKRRGMRFIWAKGRPPADWITNEFWIAQVEQRSGLRHAVVFYGTKLWWDPDPHIQREWRIGDVIGQFILEDA